MASEPGNSTRWYEILAMLTPLVVGVCITGVGALFTHVYNQRQLQLSQLTALDKFRPALVSDNPIDREFAYASFAALGYESLALKLIQVKRDSAGRAVAQAIQVTGSAAAQAEAKATLSAVPVQVYLQIGSESQRGRAEAAVAALRQAGYVPAGIEAVGGKAVIPKTTEVRFFNDADRESAEKITEILKTIGFASAHTKKVSWLTGRPGSLEVWFGADPQ